MPRSVFALIGILLGSIVWGPMVFLGIVLILALAGANAPSQYQYWGIVLVSALPAAGAVVFFTGMWILQWPRRVLRAAVALPMAGLTLAVIIALTVWMWGQGSG